MSMVSISTVTFCRRISLANLKYVFFKAKTSADVSMIFRLFSLMRFERTRGKWRASSLFMMYCRRSPGRFIMEILYSSEASLWPKLIVPAFGFVFAKSFSSMILNNHTFLLDRVFLKIIAITTEVITYITSDGRRACFEEETIPEWATFLIESCDFVYSSVCNPIFEYVFRFEFGTNTEWTIDEILFPPLLTWTTTSFDWLLADLFKNINEPSFGCEPELQPIGFWMTAFRAGTGRGTLVVIVSLNLCGVSIDLFDADGMLFRFICSPSGLGANLGYGIDDLLILMAAHFCIEGDTRTTCCRFWLEIFGLCALNFF